MLSSADKAVAEEMVREIFDPRFLSRDIDCDIGPDCASLYGERIADALRASLENPDTNDFEAGVVTAAGMLRNGDRLPDWLAVFAADVLEGKRTRPTKTGPDPYSNWQRDYSAARAVFEISARFRLPEYTNSEVSNKVTAAVIVAETASLSLEVVHKAVRKFKGQISRVTSPQDSKG